MTIRLEIICHGATSATREARFPADEPLDEGALRDLASRQGSISADKIWTSPALRARQTALALGLDATIDPDLREGDYGSWAGRSFAELSGSEPDAIAAWLADPDARPHGGETVAELMVRTAAWLDSVGQGTGRVVAISHASVIRAAVVHALGAPAASFWRIDVAPLAVLKLSGLHGRWNLVSLKSL